MAVPPVRTVDVFGPAEVFGDANRLHDGNPAYDITIISAESDPVVKSYIGKAVQTDRSYRECRGPIDTLLVAGSVGPGKMHYEAGFLDWLRKESPNTRRFGSICTGAFAPCGRGLARRATRCHALELGRRARTRLSARDRRPRSHLHSRRHVLHISRRHRRH